jgi:UTP-glucose-1-phosphate uridylyltransferase
MVGSRDTYGVDERRIQALVGKPEAKNYLEDTGVDGRIILKCIFFNVYGSVHRNNIPVYKSQQEAKVTDALVTVVLCS